MASCLSIMQIVLLALALSRESASSHVRAATHCCGATRAIRAQAAFIMLHITGSQMPQKTATSRSACRVPWLILPPASHIGCGATDAGTTSQHHCNRATLTPVLLR
jgi:hypothetical protein